MQAWNPLASKIHTYMYQKLSEQGRKCLRGSMRIQDTGITLLQDALYISAAVISELTRFKSGQSARKQETQRDRKRPSIWIVCIDSYGYRIVIHERDI